MFDFNKPKIEITEKSEKFGRFVVEPLEEDMVLHLAIHFGESCCPPCREPQ